MAKLYVLVRTSFTDFDMKVEAPISVSADRERLRAKAAYMNSMRTAKEIKSEVNFEVSRDQVDYLDA